MSCTENKKNKIYHLFSNIYSCRLSSEYIKTDLLFHWIYTFCKINWSGFEAVSFGYYSNQNKGW